MKILRNMLAVAFLATSAHSVAASADRFDDHKMCATHARIATEVMSARQQGVPVWEVREVVKRNIFSIIEQESSHLSEEEGFDLQGLYLAIWLDWADDYIQAAYKLHIGPTPRAKERRTKRMGEIVYEKCMEKYKRPPPN